jgi:SRSO17 transposase
LWRCGSARPGAGPPPGWSPTAHCRRLLAEWPLAEPTDYGLAILPADTPLPKLVRLAKIHWRIEHDYRGLKSALGLHHFAGRTWAGWYRHVTLVTAAQLFVTLLRNSPRAAAPA